MQMFILGLILGAGLVLAGQELRRLQDLRRHRQHEKFLMAVEDEIARRMQDTFVKVSSVQADYTVNRSTPDKEW